MNNIKKSIIFFILLSIMTSMLAFSLFVYAKADTQPSDGQYAYDFLKAVGALDENEVPYESDMIITRAHFIKLALHLSNDAPGVLISNDEVFADVTPATKYESYIETAFRIGYISGASDKIFEPEMPIGYEPAIKIMCNILGYETFAAANGGYPYGYAVIAERIGLTEGIMVADNNSLTMKEVMVLLRNAAEADVMDIEVIGDDVNYKSYEDATLLSERHKVLTHTGIINATCYTELYNQNSMLDSNNVRVGELTFEAAETDAYDFLGYEVKVYYDVSKKKNVNKLLYVEPTSSNKIISITNPKSILEANDNEIVYEKDGNKKSIYISGKATYIKNGKMFATTPENLPEFEKGEIEFVSNDDNNSVDVVRLTTYDTYVVSGVNKSSNAIVSKDGSLIYVEPDDDDDYTFEIMIGTSRASISDIHADDVLLVAQSVGDGLCHKKILVGQNKFEAKVSEIGDDYVIADGTLFNVDSSVKDEILLGVKSTFMFDALGNISYVKNENQTVFGYLYGVIKQGMDAPMCKIFTENNRWVELNFASKIEYNNEKLSSDAVYEKIISMGEYKQLVSYNVDKDANIIRLFTAKNIPIGSADEKNAAEDDEFRISYVGNQLVYRDSVGSFAGKVFVDSDAVIFSIPDDYSKEDFKIIRTTDLVANSPYDFTAYNVDKCLNCKLFTTDITTKHNIISSDIFMVVSGKGQILNSDGDAVPSIVGYWDGMEISFPVKLGDTRVNEEVFNSLKSGDVILFELDDNSNVVYVENYPLTGGFYFSDTPYEVQSVLAGNVTECDFETQKMRFTYNPSGEELGLAYTSSTDFYLYDAEEDTYKLSGPEEILESDTVFVNMRFYRCDNVLILRN